jgi:hypothetical protein
MMDGVAAVAASDPAPETAESAGELSALPHDVLLHVMRRMPPPDVRTLAGTCRLLRYVARDAMPGLLLDLFPHQVCHSFRADPPWVTKAHHLPPQWHCKVQDCYLEPPL